MVKKHNKFMFNRLNQTNIIALIIILILTVVGVRLLTSSHAQSPFVSIQVDSGHITPPATVQNCSGSTDGKCVMFSSGSNAPMELLNRLPNVKIYPASAATANGNYSTPWNPGTTGTVSYDLSGVPTANRANVLLAWSTAYDFGYSPQVFMTGGSAAGQTALPVNYTIDVNSSAGGGTTPPTTGWVNDVTVTNNIFYSRQHLINMINPATGTPYNWIRMNITSSLNGLNLNFDIADASKGITDDFMFIGDSITTIFAGHSSTAGPNIADLVSTAMGNSYHIVTQNSGVSGSKASGWDSVYSTFSPNKTIDYVLANFPGNYVTLNLGTNDAWGGGGNASNYYASMQDLAQAVIAAGKIPIIPDVPWPDNGDGTVWDNQVKAFNVEISKLIASNPKIIAGPDMYTILQDHPSWFQSAGNVHPNAQGEMAYRCAWAYTIAEHIYKTIPSPISACTQYVSP